MSNDTLFEKQGTGIARRLTIRFLMALLIMGIFAGALGNSRQLQTCSTPVTDVSISSHWRIGTPSQAAYILWERTLSARDTLLSSSKDSVIFFRGASSDACVQGNRLIALDTNIADLKWDFSSQVVRSIASYSDGYIFSECCTSLTKINNNGKEIWHSDSVADRTYNPVLEISSDNAYLFGDSHAYEFLFDSGKFMGTLPVVGVKAVFGAITVQVVANEMFVLSGDKPDLLWNAHVSSVDNASEIVGKIIGNSLMLSDRSRIVSYDISSGQVLWKIDESMLASPMFNEHFVFTYNAENKVRIYDIVSGHLTEEVSLQNDSVAPPNVNVSENRAYLALNQDLLFIFDKSSLTLVAMKINLTNLTNNSTP